MSSKAKVRSFVALIVGFAAFAVLSGLSYGIPEIRTQDLVSFVFLAFALEYWSVTLTHQVQGSVSFIIQIAVAILFGPTIAAVVGGLALLFSQIVMRREPVRVVFNVAQRVLALSVATQVYLALGGAIPFKGIDRDGLPF